MTYYKRKFRQNEAFSENIMICWHDQPRLSENKDTISPIRLSLDLIYDYLQLYVKRTFFYIIRFQPEGKAFTCSMYLLNL